MIKNYFENVTTAEELKKRYHELVKELHPDNGGNAADFVQMKQQFEKLSHSNIWNTHKTMNGKTYEKENTQAPEEFSDMIEKLFKFENITIEILGSWIWVTGNTRNYKDQLKELGFLFSSKKSAWYFNGDTKKRRSFSKFSYSDLQKHWGVSYSETTGEKPKMDIKPELIPTF